MMRWIFVVLSGVLSTVAGLAAAFSYMMAGPRHAWLVFMFCLAAFVVATLLLAAGVMRFPWSERRLFRYFQSVLFLFLVLTTALGAVLSLGSALKLSLILVKVFELAS